MRIKRFNSHSAPQIRLDVSETSTDEFQEGNLINRISTSYPILIPEPNLYYSNEASRSKLRGIFSER